MWKRPGKEIKDVTASSVIDLKAELFKASETVSKNKRSLYHDAAITSGTNFKRKDRNIMNASSLRDVVIDTRGQRDVDDAIEERNAHEASYVSLQRKTALYDKMRDEIHETDDFATSEIMVDFLRKSSHHPIHREGQNVQSEAQSTASVAEDPWVDITDDFGRTRLVRQSVADKMERDKETDRLRLIEEEDAEEYRRQAELERVQLMQADGVVEESFRDRDERSKRGDHYDNSKEIRTMGVGFYQFSSNSDDRSKQMSDLKDLRESTIQTRNSKVALKDAKQYARDERMRLIKQKAQQSQPPTYTN